MADRARPQAMLSNGAAQEPVDNWIEYGSGLDCSVWDEAACPTQCFWCVELARCASILEDCTVPPHSEWPVLLTFAALAIMLFLGFASRRQIAQGALHPAEPESAEDAYQLNNRTSADPPVSLSAVRDLEMQTPEGQRLLIGH